MTESIKIRLPGAKSTLSSGASLAASLYVTPMTIFLKGELGVGKTTFLQGFAKALGIKERLTSPTYAIEQRYKISKWCHPEVHCDSSMMLRGSPIGLAPQHDKKQCLEGQAKRSSDTSETTIELLHIDLYRMDPKEAKELVDSSEDCEGIRCIEWSEKISEREKVGPHIDLRIEDNDQNSERNLHIHFHDFPFPSRIQIETWREEMMLPDPVCKHCDSVGEFAEKVAHVLLDQGIIVRPRVLRSAGQLHDLLRFLDFSVRRSSLYRDPTPQEQDCWDTWKARYPNLRHESACALFLQEQGFDALATIIESHGLSLLSHDRVTIEQKVLFYADKRVIIDRVVSVKERLDDFFNRYGGGKGSAKYSRWHKEVCAIEQQLFPEGTPF